MKVKELVELACDINQFYIANVFDLEEYFYEKHDDLEVKSYSIRIDRHMTQSLIAETITMIINPKGN